MFENRDKIMVANPFQHSDQASVKIAHYNREGKRSWIEATPVVDQLCAVEAPFISNKNCEPGVLQIIYSDNDQTQTFQRNIGYGGHYGGHQFLIDAGEVNATLA